MALSDEAAPSTFVGRVRPLHALAEQWRTACTGAPRVVLLEGPAGIGKTSLVRRFLRSADPAQVLRATGDELETHLPLGVAEQLCGDLAGPDTAGAGHDPFAAGAALVRRFGDLQAREPLLVVVDDAHWADTPSLQALTFALRRLQADRVLGVVVSRDEPLALPDGLRRLAGSERGLTLYLRGLDVGEIGVLAAELGAGTLPRRVAARLRDHTGGNPLYASALLRELGPAALQDASGPLPAPQVFSMAMLSRLADCSPQAQELVTAAAVLGQRCDLATAARLAGLESALAALEEAVDAGLLETAAGSVDVIAFSHPLVRATVYHDLGPARRCGLHQRAAGFMQGAPALEHRAAATVGDDAELGAALAAHAAHEARTGAFSAAAAHVDAAARVEPDPTRRGRLELEAVEMLLRGGEIAAAAAREARVAALPADATRHAVLGHLALLTGRQGDAERLLAAAWDTAEPDREREVAAAAAAQLSQLLLSQARGAESTDWSRRALAHADDPFTRALATSVLVGALAIQGRGDEGLALVADLPVGVTTLPAEEMEGVMARGVVGLWTGRYADARTDLATIVGLHASWRPLRMRAISLAYLAVAEFFLGAWDDSVGHGDLAVSLAADTDFVWVFPLMHYSAALALAGRGQWQAAQAHADATVAASELLGDASAVGYGSTAAAWVAYCRGEPGKVVDAVGPVLALGLRDGIDEPGVMLWQAPHAEALVALGRLDEARAALEPFEERATDRRHPVATADAARARGLLEAAAGRRDAALAAFEAGGAALDGVPVPFERARLALAFGQVLRRHGRRRRAVEQLNAAREVFQGLGAEPFTARCERELAACGLAPSRRRPEERLRLTPQELAVARLVAAGMSNREVAGELVISTKTVEYHLGNVYTKLGVRSRTRLAAHLGET